MNPFEHLILIWRSKLFFNGGLGRKGDVIFVPFEKKDKGYEEKERGKKEQAWTRTGSRKARRRREAVLCKQSSKLKREKKDALCLWTEEYNIYIIYVRIIYVYTYDIIRDQIFIIYNVFLKKKNLFITLEYSLINWIGTDKLSSFKKKNTFLVATWVFRIDKRIL